jgi:hypothetical protein
MFLLLPVLHKTASRLGFRPAVAAWIVGSLTLGSPDLPAGQELSIGANTEWEIIVENGAPDSVEFAARELQTYVEKITGKKLPLRQRRTSPETSAIYLGNTEFSKSRNITTEDLPSDGFRILTGESWIIIAGKDYVGPPLVGYDNPYRINESYNSDLKLSAFGDTGTLQGVYEFLRQYGGVRWYMPGELGEIVPTKPQITVPSLDLTKAPAFEQRYAYFCFFQNSPTDALWYKRAGFGAPFPAEVTHSFGRLFIKYKDTHPEYFALVNGERDFTNLSTIVGPGNLNLANEALVQRTIDDIDAFFDKNPGKKLFSLCPNDGMKKISEDPESQSQIDHARGEAGKFSNYVWGFIDKVAKEVLKRHPDKLIGCIAYEHYALPPSNLDKLSPNIAVVICKFRRNLGDSGYAQEQEEIINMWKNKASVLYAWEYYCDVLLNPGWRGYPAFYPTNVAKDLKNLAGTFKGEFIEAESWVPAQYANPDDIKINYPGIQHPMLYLTARLLWNPHESTDEILGEYYASFYGPAADQMRQFWETAESAWMARGTTESPAAVYDRDTISKMLRHLEAARGQVPSDSAFRRRIALIENEFSPVATQRARLEKLANLAVEIPQIRSHNASGSVPEPWADATLLKLIDRDFQAARPPTHIRLGWTPEALRIHVKCFEPGMRNLRAQIVPNEQSEDQPVWEDDSVEFFLKPISAGESRSYHFVVNSLGAVFDAVNATDSWNKDDRSWKGNVVPTLQKSDAWWSIEMSVPWNDLGMKANAGAELKANFFRNRFAGGDLQQSSWAPMQTGHYFSPADFGTLILSNQQAE